MRGDVVAIPASLLAIDYLSRVSNLVRSGLVGTVRSGSMRARVAQRDGGVCAHCPTGRGPWPYEGWQADHVIPIVLGGPDTLENVVTLCIEHHRVKTAIDGSRHTRKRAPKPPRPPRPPKKPKLPRVKYKPPPRPDQLSNTELADRLGLSPSAASLLRNGKRRPGLRVRVAIVECLGADHKTLNDAMTAAQRGNKVPLATYMQELCTAAARDRQSRAR